MAGIFEGIKKALTTNPLKEAAKTGDAPAPTYVPPTESPASMAARNAQAATDKAAAMETARKKRANASRMTADGVAKQLQDSVK